MSNFRKLKYNQDLVAIRHNNVRKINQEEFIALSKSIFKLNKNNSVGFRKLNREKDAIILNPEKNEKINSNAELNGYYKLNGFANVFRKTIKISYCTLYNRINKNPTLEQFLIDNEYIFSSVCKKQDENRTYRKKNILVNYEKRFEFAALITQAFLNDFQRNCEV